MATLISTRDGSASTRTTSGTWASTDPTLPVEVLEKFHADDLYIAIVKAGLKSVRAVGVGKRGMVELLKKHSARRVEDWLLLAVSSYPCDQRYKALGAVDRATLLVYGREALASRTEKPTPRR